MNIVVEIKAPEIAKALMAVAEAFGGKITAEMPKQAKVKETKEETPKVEAEVVGMAQDKPIDTSKAIDAEIIEDKPKEEPQYTLEQVREKLTGLSRSGKREEVKALIESYGVSKLTDIPSEHFAEVMQKAEVM